MTAKGADVVWRIAATPKPGWALFQTRYPQIALNEQLGSSPVDDCILVGLAKGGVQRWPMRPGRTGWRWRERRAGNYPGTLASQFGCFYDDGGGLYTAAYDTEAHTKELLMDRWWREKRPDGSWRDGDLALSWSRYGYSEGADAQAYDIVTRGFAGADGAPATWHDAADIYKAWAQRQKWCRAKFLDRTDLPDWAREAPAVMQFDRTWLDRPELLKRWLTEYWNKKFPGVPFLAVVFGWEHHGDWITTEYFPCYPSDAKFKEMMVWIKAAGGHPWAWPGGHHWNLTVGKKKDGSYRLDFTKDFWARVAPHAVRDPDGNVHLDDLVWLDGGTSASLCPADPWTVDWWNKDVARALVERGCDLVQADQDVGARVPSCWSTQHGHAPGPGPWEMKAMRHQFETMLAEMRKVNPTALFSFEEPHEYYNDILSFVDYRNCRDGATEWASVYSYLYHDYVSPFQTGVEVGSRPVWLAFCAADGQMPCLPTSLSFYGGLLDEPFPNGDFETLVPGGKGFADWESPETHGVSQDAAEGRYALRVDASGRDRRQIARNLVSDCFFMPGRTYRLTVSLKGLRDHPSNEVVLGAIAKSDGKWVSRGGVSIPVPKAACGWQTSSREFVMPERTECVRLMLNANKGTAFLVDGVKIEAKAADGTFRPLSPDDANPMGTRAFCEAWVRLYHGEGRKFLAHGRQLRPPEFRCAYRPYAEDFRGYETKNLVKPTVFHALWEARDGSRALALANATDREQPVAWKTASGAWQKATVAPNGLKLIPILDTADATGASLSRSTKQNQRKGNEK